MRMSPMEILSGLQRIRMILWNIGSIPNISKNLKIEIEEALKEIETIILDFLMRGVKK